MRSEMCEARRLLLALAIKKYCATIPLHTFTDEQATNDNEKKCFVQYLFVTSRLRNEIRNQISGQTKT